MIVKIEASKCTGCGACLDECLCDAIVMEGSVAVVRTDSCRGCQICQASCLNQAIIEDKPASV
jgi:MinD superfamily P-loop ATPase